MIAGFDPTAALSITAAAEAAAIQSTWRLTLGRLNWYAPRNLSQEQLLRLPRIGAAYSLSSKIVIRGGYGIFYDTINVLNRLPTFNYDRDALARGPLQERPELS